VSDESASAPMPGDGQRPPRYCGDCGAPTPAHWPDCPTLQEQAAGAEVTSSFSNQAPRRCPRCGSAMTRNHDQQSDTWTDNCTGVMCGVTLEAEAPAVLDPSPAAGFDAIAAMPGAQVFEEPYPGEGELCPSCLQPVRPETGEPYVQVDRDFFHKPCWDDSQVGPREVGDT